MRIAPVVLIVALGSANAGCGAPVDLKQTLQIEGLTGGYRDAGIVVGRNKVVPTVTFRNVMELFRSVGMRKRIWKTPVPRPGAGPA